MYKRDALEVLADQGSDDEDHDQERGILEAQLIDRDEHTDYLLSLPQGTIVRTEKQSKEGKACGEWQIVELGHGGKHSYPTFAPDCKEWVPSGGASETVGDCSGLVPFCKD